jgi:hypothetical protein
LHLTNSNEKPEGTVTEIGENFVLLKNIDGTQSRFFDKLIGGWDLIKGNPVKERKYTPATVNKPVYPSVPIPTNSNRPSVSRPFGTKVIPRTVQPAVIYPVSAHIEKGIPTPEKEILTLIEDGKNEEAMRKLNENLRRPNIGAKYKR